ncbi:MAG TPA: FecR domain-containing protein [Planctomycetota bacterium]|nr:FecR domain-containing protein [Planctomycetota bacterium]
MEREREELLMRFFDGDFAAADASRLKVLLETDRDFQEEFLKLARQERVLRALLNDRRNELLSREIMNQLRAQEDSDDFVANVKKEITGRQLGVGKKRTSSTSDRAVRPGSSAKQRAVKPGSSSTQRAIKAGRSVRTRRRPAERGNYWAIPLSIAAMLLIAMGLFVFTSQNSPSATSLLTVSEVSGEVNIAEKAGTRKVTSGLVLSGGEILRTGSDGRVGLRYSDGTSIEAKAGSQVQISQSGAEASKQLHLESGSLVADVQPQPDNLPFIVTTPHARAIVRGTVLSLVLGSDNTRLEVRRGKVALERNSDKAEVLVSEGRYAVASRDAAVAMKAELIDQPATAKADPPAAPKAPLRDANEKDFLTRTFQPAGKHPSVPYRLFVPANYDKSQSYPLVLFLHGLGEKGTDNTKPLKNKALGAMVFVNAKNQAEFPCFMLVPQSASGWWAEYIPPLTQLIAELGKEYSIDKNRLYITGLSFGGTGTWMFIAREPNLFAAAVPICGGGEVNKASAVVGIPIWNFHTADDPTMKVDGSRKMIEAIRKAGGKPFYTEYASGGHGSAWVRGYAEPNLVSWVMAQHKGKEATAPNPLPFSR